MNRAWEVQCISKCNVVKLFFECGEEIGVKGDFNGRTASDPYTNMNSVSPIAFFSVVLNNHRILCSSSAHLPLASSSFFCSP